MNIIVADDERYMREYYQELLPRLGHHVVVAEGGRQLVEQCRLLNPDLVIADVRMPDLDGLEAAAEVNRDREVPFVLVTAHHDAELMARARERHVMAYLVKPVKQADLAAAVELATTRFEQMRGLRQDAAGLRQALEERKLIERAKGAVVLRLGVSEEEAYRRLRKVASDQNRKLVEVAKEVLQAEGVYAELESGRRHR